VTTYYDRFNPANNWASLLAIAGRRVQAAEFNEIQSMSIYRDRRIGDVLFGTGHIIDGCQIAVNDAMAEANITPGSVYYDGMIFDLPAATVDIAGAGQEVIGLKVTYSVVTHEEDPSLKDPAIGYQNYGMPGMDRKVANLVWVKDDPAAFPVFRLQDGVVVVAAVPPELEGITPILARRTYDTSGDFLVSGMEGFIEPKDAGFVTLGIEAGKAYVLGREINKLVPTRMDLAKATTVRTVQNETKTYATGTSNYTLNSKPVKQINQVTATVEVTQNITRGNTPGTTDTLPKTPVVAIVSVSQGGTTYTAGVDYQLSGNAVDWSLGGIEPGGGTSYSVTWQYTKVMVADVDYELENNDTKFLSGDTPVNGSTFQTTYDFYLGRKDLFYLDGNGDFQVAQGQPEVFPALPMAPPNVLVLGEIHLPPNSDSVVVTNYDPKRLTMLELRSMLKRLERAEYNQSLSELDRDAQVSDPTVLKLGIFTDNFTSFERSDVYHADWDAMIYPAEKTLILPVDTEVDDLAVDTANTTARLHEMLATLPYTEEVVLSQDKATELWNVNPYNVFGNEAIIHLNPSQDVWVEESVVTKNVQGWFNSWTGDTRNETRVLLDEIVPFIRQKTVTVRGESFLPNADNIQATFDGVAVALTPVAPTAAGTNPDTVKADADGKLKATFTIPANIRSGTREVRLFNMV
jgi:hypothetical protein